MANRKSKKKRDRVSARSAANSAGAGDSKYFRTPEGYTTFSPKAKKYRFDLLCFRAGKGNPKVDEGEVWYERTFWIHRDIGPNKEWHLCAAKTFNEPCPVCEYRAKQAMDPDSDEEVIKELAPKQRQLWLPRDLASDGEEKLIWEFSFHLFGKQLYKKIKNSDEEDEYEYFADPEDGKTIRVSFEQSEHGKWVEAADIEFRPRKSQYTLADVDEMPCLDDLLVATPYDKLKALFLQTEESDDEDGPEEKPKRRKSKPKEESEEEDETKTAEDAGLEEGDKVSNEDWGECEIVRISGDGTSLTLEDGDGDLHKGISCDEVEKIKPKKKKPKAKPQSKPKPAEDEGDEDEEEDKPSQKSKPKAKKPSKKKKEEEPEDEGDNDEEWDEDW